MRRQETELLNRPYEDDSGDVGDRFARALSIDLPNVRALAADLFADLDPKVFGIGWWASYPNLGDKRRILIGDYLNVSIDSIEMNLTEAKLHLFELLDWWERQNTLMADAIARDPRTGDLTIRHPPQTSPAVRLPGAMCTLHTAGFFRALNSALDCLGAVLTGVAALPLAIVKCDLARARTNLASRLNDPADPRAELARRFQEAADKAGPAGWLEWITQFRHMLLHRARRLQAGELVQRSPPLYGPDNQLVPRADTVPFLASEPAWSEVDVVRAAAESDLLHEHASETAHGALASTIFLVDAFCGALREFWTARKAQPTLIEQPTSQWPSTDIPPSVGFLGYCSRSFGQGHLAASPSYVHRLRCAALSTDDVHLWQTFT
jgi:hypothetical protein